jgi:hypothetical protein
MSKATAGAKGMRNRIQKMLPWDLNQVIKGIRIRILKELMMIILNRMAVISMKPQMKTSSKVILKITKKLAKKHPKS